MSTRHEVTETYARAYVQAGKAEKGRLLDELVQSTGWSRDHARRAIRWAGQRRGPRDGVPRKPRPRKYSHDALMVLLEVWRLSGQPSGKYLAAIMNDTLDRLVRHREFGSVADLVTPEVIHEVRAMSAATIDRYLKPHKGARSRAGGAPVDAFGVLRAPLAVRTGSEASVAPGLMKLHTIAHCGDNPRGEFLRTLAASDPVTGWTLLRSIPNGALVHVNAALEWITAQSPVPITRVEFNNGTEFMNWGVIAWYSARGIPVVGVRVHQHNENGQTEPSNGDWMCKRTCRQRYQTPAELALLNQLWGLVMDRRNHLLPCVKTTGRITSTAGSKTRVYDEPRTPYQRLIDAGALDEGVRVQLERYHADLNPARLTRRINEIQQQLIDCAASHGEDARPAA